MARFFDLGIPVNILPKPVLTPASLAPDNLAPDSLPLANYGYFRSNWSEGVKRRKSWGPGRLAWLNGGGRG
jgi:hypothetical protein